MNHPGQISLVSPPSRTVPADQSIRWKINTGCMIIQKWWVCGDIKRKMSLNIHTATFSCSLLRHEIKVCPSITACHIITNFVHIYIMCLRCLLHHILSLIAYTFREFFFIIILQLMMSANSQIRFGLQIVFVCLHLTPYHNHHCANLSEDIKLIKCLSDIFCKACEWE